MSPTELSALADDIAAHGLQDAVTRTPANELLDGRNRALACVMAGVDLKTVIYEGDPWLFSLSKNRHRRHMSVEQLAMIAAALATRPLGSNQREDGFRKPPSIAGAAKAAGVSETSVKAAKIVLKDGSPEEVAAVKAGRAKLQPTANRIREQKRASAQKAEKTQKKSDPAPDPIDDVAVEVITKASDGKWRTAETKRSRPSSASRPRRPGGR